jgi:hypothetical protein
MDEVLLKSEVHKSHQSLRLFERENEANLYLLWILQTLIDSFEAGRKWGILGDRETHMRSLVGDGILGLSCNGFQLKCHKMCFTHELLPKSINIIYIREILKTQCEK